MDKKLLPPTEYLRQLLDYNADTGALTWRERSASHFPEGFRTSQGNCNIWNTRYAGKEAFTASNKRGYKIGQFNSRAYLAHRIIWKIVTGEEPVVIDHLDGDTSNNRFTNLRSVTGATNGKNRKLRADCRHGYAGIVYSDAPYRPWKATIGVDGALVYIGAFATKEEAIAARSAAEIKYGFIQR